MAESVRQIVDNSCCFRQLRNCEARLIFEITRKCNLGCKHCMVPMEGSSSTDISHERIIQLMNELAINNISKIMFTGGEPLLIKGIIEYIEIAAKNGAIVDLNSNLTLINESMVSELKDAGLGEVTTSIDGDEKTHCAIRNDSNSFRKTINAIKMLKHAGIPVDIVCTVMKTNIEKVEDVVRIANDIGVSSLTFSGLILDGRAKEEEDNYDKIKLKSIIESLRNTSKVPIRTVRLFNNDFSCCHKGLDMIGIDYLGNVHPCLQDKLESAPSILGHSLKSCISTIQTEFLHTPCACFITKKSV